MQKNVIVIIGKGRSLCIFMARFENNVAFISYAYVLLHQLNGLIFSLNINLAFYNEYASSFNLYNSFF